jgi:thioredoxin reductase (NADPH)
MSDARNLIIIGGGPAGYTPRSTRRGRIGAPRDRGLQWGGQLMITSDVENYPGYPRESWGRR